MGCVAPVGELVSTAGRRGMIAENGQGAKGFLWWGVMARHDGGMQLTPLRGPKIGAFLKRRIDSNVIPIYEWRRN